VAKNFLKASNTMVNFKPEDVRERLGNIDQVRELLFGHIVSDYEQRFDASMQRLSRLESEVASFQTEIRAQISQLQESLTNELRSGLSSLEKQVQYLSYNAHEQTNHLQYRVHEIEQKSDNGLETLQQTVTSQTNGIKTDLTQAKEQLEAALRALEKRVFEEIDKDLTTMKSGKVSRVDLADLLFELCLKVKGADFIPQLPPGSANSGDYLLPEQNSGHHQEQPVEVH
jgi:iron-sulfur cluster repair protein YtfE (RIC family)